jgi:hypothetical protein
MLRFFFSYLQIFSNEDVQVKEKASSI